jgi:hypothetical protein
MNFIDSDVTGSSGLKSIYVIEFRRYKNIRPAGGGNFCLLAQFLLINQWFASRRRWIKTVTTGLIGRRGFPVISAKAIPGGDPPVLTNGF